MDFGECLRACRHAEGLTQVELARRSGIARPNVAAYEAGRREPLISTAETLLSAAGSALVVPERVTWTWTTARRPYAVPSRLWRLAAEDALARFEPGIHLWWSGPARTLDLAHRAQRLRAYEIVLREGGPEDIERIVDGVLLCEGWPDLVLPPELRSAWQPLIDGAVGRDLAEIDAV